MLSSKLFSLLTFAAAAVAQGFPTGDFFISHVETELVFEVENGSLIPGAPIVLSERSKDNDAQIWSYAQGYGFLTNKGSNLVIEVPTTDGFIQYGTKLQQAVPRNETNDDLVQLWDYDAPLQHLFTLAATTACVTANDSMVYAIVDSCDSSGRLFDQRWSFIDVEDQDSSSA